jgi:hypothetical protein
MWPLTASSATRTPLLPLPHSPWGWGHGPNAQAFSHSGDRLHDTLGRSGLPIQGHTVRFEEIGVTDNTVELSPAHTTRMAVRTDITLPDPAIIGALLVVTVMDMSIDRSRTPALGGDEGQR